MTPAHLPLPIGSFAVCLDPDRGFYGHASQEEDVRPLASSTVNEHHSHVIDIIAVDKVMPKTFMGRPYGRNAVSERGRRYWRSIVVGVAPTLLGAVSLRAAVLLVGSRCDRDIEVELRPHVAAVEAKHRARALTDLRALLPKSFGGDAA